MCVYVVYVFSFVCVLCAVRWSPPQINAKKTNNMWCPVLRVRRLKVHHQMPMPLHIVRGVDSTAYWLTVVATAYFLQWLYWLFLRNTVLGECTDWTAAFSRYTVILPCDNSVSVYYICCYLIYTMSSKPPAEAHSSPSVSKNQTKRQHPTTPCVRPYGPLLKSVSYVIYYM